jgi:hypothetical protein
MQCLTKSFLAPGVLLSDLRPHWDSIRVDPSRRSTSAATPDVEAHEAHDENSPTWVRRIRDEDGVPMLALFGRRQWTVTSCGRLLDGTHLPSELVFLIYQAGYLSTGLAFILFQA